MRTPPGDCFWTCVTAICDVKTERNDRCSETRFVLWCMLFFINHVRYSKFRFSRFKKFIPRSVFCALQFTQISLDFQTSCSNLKIWGLEQKYIWLFYEFHFERNFDVLKSKSPYFLLNNNIHFNKNETESKMKNPTKCFREMNLVLKLVQELGMKSKTEMSWSPRKKRVHFL